MRRHQFRIVAPSVEGTWGEEVLLSVDLSEVENE